MEIPQLDIGKLVSNPLCPHIQAELGQSLGKALSSIGFVYLTSHGIDQDLVHSTMAVSRKFFLQQQDLKDQVTSCEETQQGYVKPGMEIFDQSEDGLRALTELQESYEVSDIGPNSLFPDATLPEMRANLTQLAEDLKMLGLNLLRCLAGALGLGEKDKEVLVDYHQRILGPQNASKIRSLFYPPIPDQVPVGVILCEEHSDYGTITFLFQDDLGGLEVRAVNGSWVQATPIKNSFLVNFGDLLQIFSNGLFPATLHRVVIPKGEKELQQEGRTRNRRDNPPQSIVFFLHPDGEAICQP